MTIPRNSEITQDMLKKLFVYNDGKLNKPGRVCKLLVNTNDHPTGKDRSHKKRVLGSNQSLHNLIWIYFNGNIPENMYVIFEDKNVDNTRIENLRLEMKCYKFCRNRKTSNPKSSKYKGVGLKLATGKWYSRIRVFGQMISLGCFSNEEDAALAYNIASYKYFGDISCKNEV